MIIPGTCFIYNKPQVFMLLFIIPGGCLLGFAFRDMINCSVLFGLNLTSQFSDHLCIFSRSEFIRSAAIAGSSTIRYRDVSSANNLIQKFMSLTISLIYIRNKSGRSIDPWGTPALISL